MIDFVNIQITNTDILENNLENINFIDLISNINIKTGELEAYPKKAFYHNFVIRLNKKFSKIVGSFHKFNNIINLDKNHNFNDFTYDELEVLLPEFIDKFDLEDNNYLSKLELGFNLKLNIDPQGIIDNNLLLYNFGNHSRNEKFRSKGDYKEFIKSDYSLKIYNKSKQYRVKEYILRIELKLTSKRKIQSFEIFSLKDLLNKDKITNLFNFLMKEFDRLTIIDSYDEHQISGKDLEKLNTYTNPNFWQRIRSSKSYKVQKRLKGDFDLVINKNGLNSLKLDLKDKLNSNFEQLLHYGERQ